MQNFKYNNKSFIMPMSAFDPFRTSWFECSSCGNPLFEKQIMSKIPHICPHCGVHLENIICEEQAFHILYKPATMPSIDALKCIKVTNCYVWFYDDEKECEVKAKKGEGTYFNGNDVEKWEQVKIYGYLIRAIDD